jgi:hypothetical protein
MSPLRLLSKEPHPRINRCGSAETQLVLQALSRYAAVRAVHRRFMFGAMYESAQLFVPV